MSGINHSTRGHALLSASGSKRWMNCTPSARLEERMSSEEESIFAKEGTLAHELSDIILQKAFKDMPIKAFNAEKRKIKNAVVKLLSAEAFEEMETEVAKYVDIVSEAYNVALKANPGAVLILEERLDYSHIVPEGFGTGDTMIVSDGLLDNYDLKYGRGISVEAKSNPQLMLYGLGALRRFELQYDIQEVQMNIVQPRLNNYSSWKCSVQYLEKWGEKVVKPVAEKAFAGEGDKCAGDWCKWCKFKPVCPTIKEKALEVAKHEFAPVDEVSLSELAEVMKQSEIITDWLSAVKKHLLTQIQKGEKVPGFKVVAGRSNRKWINETKTICILDKLPNIEVTDFMVSKVKGIAAIEKLVGKETFEEHFSKAFEKPTGAPTLAPFSDKRPAMGLAQAKEDFNEPLN